MINIKDISYTTPRLIDNILFEDFDDIDNDNIDNDITIAQDISSAYIQTLKNKLFDAKNTTCLNDLLDFISAVTYNLLVEPLELAYGTLIYDTFPQYTLPYGKKDPETIFSNTLGIINDLTNKSADYSISIVVKQRKLGISASIYVGDTYGNGQMLIRRCYRNLTADLKNDAMPEISSVFPKMLIDGNVRKTRLFKIFERDCIYSNSYANGKHCGGLYSMYDWNKMNINSSIYTSVRTHTERMIKNLNNMLGVSIDFIEIILRHDLISTDGLIYSYENDEFATLYIDFENRENGQPYAKYDIEPTDGYVDDSDDVDNESVKESAILTEDFDDIDADDNTDDLSDTEFSNKMTLEYLTEYVRNLIAPNNAKYSNHYAIDIDYYDDVKVLRNATPEYRALKTLADRFYKIIREDVEHCQLHYGCDMDLEDTFVLDFVPPKTIDTNDVFGIYVTKEENDYIINYDYKFIPRFINDGYIYFETDESTWRMQTLQEYKNFMLGLQKDPVPDCLVKYNDKEFKLQYSASLKYFQEKTRGYIIHRVIRNDLFTPARNQYLKKANSNGCRVNIGTYDEYINNLIYEVFPRNKETAKSEYRASDNIVKLFVGVKAKFVQEFKNYLNVNDNNVKIRMTIYFGDDLFLQKTYDDLTNYRYDVAKNDIIDILHYPMYYSNGIGFARTIQVV